MTDNNKGHTTQRPTLDDWKSVPRGKENFADIGPTIKDVRVLNPAGPWKTKSEAELRVPIALDKETVLGDFLKFDYPTYRHGSTKLGLRLYMVSGIPKGTLGADEFHIDREEIVFCMSGEILWECEDIYGQKVTYKISPGQGVWTPPYILHTYKAMENNSTLIVLCNTLFDTEDVKTFDSFSADDFKQLQKELLDSTD